MTYPWVTWPGGNKPPMHRLIRVRVQYRDGLVEEVPQAKQRRWNHRGDERDIVAYQIV